MVAYTQPSRGVIKTSSGEIQSFISTADFENDRGTISSFGEEWKKFSSFTEEEISTAGGEYFDVITEEMLNKSSVVLDVGCGSGRWSRYIAPRVKWIEAVDPSDAVHAALENLKGFSNVRVTQAGADTLPFPDESFDFIMAIGVLHHVPDTFSAMRKILAKLKPGGSFFVYLYYSLDNRGVMYKLLFYCSNIMRMLISALPGILKRVVCDMIAVVVYFPLASAGKLMQKFFPGSSWLQSVPLSYYSGKSFFIMRNDALDRFGTPLEKRFSKKEIEEMLSAAGLREIRFSSRAPFWHAVGKK